VNNIQFDWNDATVCQFTNESIKPDQLNRAKYASYLHSYLSNYKNTSYVLNLNCSWGAGKTYFVKRWANSIQHKHPVIYLDAWINDNNNDPLLLVLSEIIEQLKLLVSTKHKDAMDSIVDKSLLVVKAVAPELAKGLIKKLVNIDLDSINEKLESDQTTDTKVLENTASAALKELLNLHKKRKTSIDDLKLSIEALLSKVITNRNEDGNQRWSPMYIFIDELDRCRPTFAIELLEVIKHIFSMDRVIFVISTDTEQLQHSIRAVYGNGFDSQKYLMRFFDRSFSLPSPQPIQYIKTLNSSKIIIDRLISTNSLYIFELNEEDSTALISFIFEGFSLDLRSITQIIERLNGVLINHPDEDGVIWLLVLECLRVALPSGYNKLIKGKAVNSTSVSNFNQFIIEPLEEISSNHKKTHQQEITLQISKNITKAEPLVVSRNYSNQKEIKTINEDNVTITFSSLISLISEMFLANFAGGDNEKVNPINAYLFKTKKENSSRFKDYVEIASNLE
jgi:hypothetical protein